MTFNSQEKMFHMKRLKTITITKKQTKNRTKPETHKGFNSTPYGVHKIQDRSQNAPEWRLIVRTQ